MRYQGSDAHVSVVLLEELKAKASDWEPLTSGLFADGERYLLVDKEFKECVLRHCRY